VARLGAHTSNAKGVTTGDIDGDGWIDALYSNAFNTAPASLYVNQGAGNPGFFTSTASRAASPPTSRPAGRCSPTWTTTGTSTW
jgi:hypothetical protein